MFGQLWDYVSQLWKKEARHLIVQPLNQQQPNAVADLHYFRLWLDEMFLTNEREWFIDRYPAVNSMLRYQFGDQPNLELPNIVDSTRMGFPEKKAQGDIVIKNVLLTPTIPFRGGEVELSAGLLSLKGKNYLNRFIKTLGSFAKLLSVPQLSTALEVVGPLASGIQELFSSEDGELHLGFMSGYNADSLQPRHLAIVRADSGQLDVSKFRVKNNQLHIDNNGKLERLTGFDYMLLRFDVFEDRDDWASLKNIDKPFQEAVKFLQDKSSHAKAKKALREAILATFQAPELTEAHRRIIVEELKKRFNERMQAFEVHGLERAEQLTLETLVQMGRTPASASQFGPITFSEVLDVLDELR